jgi:Bax protein
MKIMSLFISFFTLASLLISAPSYAEIKIKQFAGITYIENATVEELEAVYTKYKYKRFRALDDDAYPAIFVKTLPIDFQEISSQKYRNELFIRILTPLALKINEEISNERHALLRLEKSFIKNKTLTPNELERLENLAIKYDYFTREKGDIKIGLQFQNLKKRINIIPPSIFIAAAAMESNWGFSRPAKLANSLYKEKVWFTNEGLEPLENKEDGYRFKIFDSLIESMRSFALTFNSNINYEHAWSARDGMIERLGVILGENIAYSLSNSSNLPNFVGILDYTTAFYDLFALDIGHLKRERP